MKQYPIDFVVLWVDGNNQEWNNQRAYYACKEEPNAYSNGDQRFRDWALFKYWFRGVETYAPWVRKIHLVTCGHLPSWLNANHPKLHIVKHEDIIPKEFLPTFNSHTIELYINRIDGLSEHFVYFNDDMFIIDQTSDSMFFHNGVPCSAAGLSINSDLDLDFVCILLHSINLINRNFSSRKVIRKWWYKFINPKYGVRHNLNSVLLLPWCMFWFPGFRLSHGPNAFLKSTMDKIWEQEKETLLFTCSHKFREYHDVNQYIVRWWQWCEGHFHPIDERKLLCCADVGMDTDMICNRIIHPKCPILVINDASISDYETKKKLISSAFESRFSKKVRLKYEWLFNNSNRGKRNEKN